jgi:hypothetical protein
VDTLKGNLELFGLESIASLLASARKTGALRVAVDGLNGRLFFVDGSLVYATTRKLDGSVNDLRGRGTEVRDRRHTWSLSLPELLRHQITDVLVRILRRDGGEFVFDEGVTTTALPSGRTLSFSAGDMIRAAQERLDEWREIEEAIPDSTVRYRLAPDLPPDLFEINVDARMWTFLAAIGDGASASDLAERLRIFEFPAAKKMAEFVRSGLLLPVDADAVARAVERARATRDLHRRVDEAQMEAEPAESPADVVVTMVPSDDAVPVPAGAGDAEPEVSEPDPEDDEPQAGREGGGVEQFGAETRSHSLAEWGATHGPVEDASVDTSATSDVISEVASDGDPTAAGPADREPEPPGAFPEVPGPPPWAANGPDDAPG